MSLCKSEGTPNVERFHVPQCGQIALAVAAVSQIEEQHAVPVGDEQRSVVQQLPLVAAQAMHQITVAPFSVGTCQPESVTPSSD